MRTTLDIDEEVLLTVKEIAHQRKTSAGSVISSLLRESLQPKVTKMQYRNGVPVLPWRPYGPEVTVELVNRLRDDE